MLKINNQTTSLKERKEEMNDRKLKEKLEKRAVQLGIKGEADDNIPKEDNVEKVLSKEEKLKAEEEVARKQKEAADFILKLNAEKKERRKKEEERQRALEEKLKRESEEFNAKLKEREDEILKKRKEKSIQTYEEMKKKREEDKRLRQARSRSSLPPKDEYLYKKLEERYQKEVLMPMLEEKKKELAMKRNKYKSINKEEVMTHMKKHDLLMAQKEENRLQDLREKREKELEMQASIGRLRTNLHERHVQEELKQKAERERKKLEDRARREKMGNYANLIKETCPVKADSSKARQLQEQIENLKHPVREKRDTRKNYDPIRLKESASNILPDKTNKDYPVDKIKNESSYTSEYTSARNLKKKRLKKMAQTAEEINPGAAKIDYLTELRRKRGTNKDPKIPKYDWAADLNNNKLDANEKYSKLIGKASLIEERAKMEEKLLNVKGGAEHNPEMGEHISDMFIDAIKAKLAILENF